MFEQTSNVSVIRGLCIKKNPFTQRECRKKKVNSHKKVKIGKERMELKNLEASFIFTSNVHQDFEKRSYIFKIDNIVFTIYKPSPHLVNMTGLKNFDAVESYRKDLEKCFQQKVEHGRIDNTFFSRKQKKKTLIWLAYMLI